MLLRVSSDTTLNIRDVCAATGLSQDTIEAHVKGRKGRKGKWVAPGCDDLVDGEFIPKKPPEWWFRGIGPLEKYGKPEVAGRACTIFAAHRGYFGAERSVIRITIDIANDDPYYPRLKD